MDYPNSVTATYDFFGDRSAVAVVDLPNRLDHLISKLPLGHLYSVDDLIYQHTHYPFYAPFLTPDRAILLRNMMQGGGRNRVAERIGLPARQLNTPTHLRFCLLCVEQDRSNLGETYWHRIHQVPGVDVCPHHAVFLEESNRLWRNSSNPGKPFPAELSVLDKPLRSLDTANQTQRLQLNIAQHALRLLECSGDNIGGQTIRFRYHNLLLLRAV